MNSTFSGHFGYRRLLRVTLPSIVMMIFTSIYCVTDGFFVSNFAGKAAFTAVNFIMPYLMILGCVGFLFGFSFFPYTLIVIALFGISLPQYLICYLLNDPIQKNIISPWERMQAQKET